MLSSFLTYGPAACGTLYVDYLHHPLRHKNSIFSTIIYQISLRQAIKLFPLVSKIWSPFWGEKTNRRLGVQTSSSIGSVGDEGRCVGTGSSAGDVLGWADEGVEDVDMHVYMYIFINTYIEYIYIYIVNFCCRIKPSFYMVLQWRPQSFKCPEKKQHTQICDGVIPVIHVGSSKNSRHGLLSITILEAKACIPVWSGYMPSFHTENLLVE